MGGVATVQREGVAININLHSYVILLFTEFLLFHLKQKKKIKTKQAKQKKTEQTNKKLAAKQN